MIDSNAYINNEMNNYDYIDNDQVEWYKEKILHLNEEFQQIIPPMVFFHMPLQEYKTANDLYEQGNNKVKYYFGGIGETMIDKICCSNYPSKLFDTALKLDSTKAMFCGHNHFNNISLEYKGIRLTYGMSIDYIIMPGTDKETKQRGTKSITIDKYSNFEINQIILTLTL